MTRITGNLLWQRCCRHIADKLKSCFRYVGDMLLQSHFEKDLVFFGVLHWLARKLASWWEIQYWWRRIPVQIPCLGRKSWSGRIFVFGSLQADGTYSTSESFVFNEVDGGEYGSGGLLLKTSESIRRGQTFDFCLTCIGHNHRLVSKYCRSRSFAFGENRHKSRPSWKQIGQTEMLFY